MLTKDQVEEYIELFEGEYQNGEIMSLAKSHLELYEKLEQSDRRFAEGFAKGQESVKRKNKSGCCCILNDDNQFESICSAHADWKDAVVGGGNFMNMAVSIQSLLEAYQGK